MLGWSPSGLVYSEPLELLLLELVYRLWLYGLVQVLFVYLARSPSELALCLLSPLLLGAWLLCQRLLIAVLGLLICFVVELSPIHC